MEFIEYSLASLRDESIRLANEVGKGGYNPDCVAYLARGGWIIGEAVAAHFSAPVIELTAHRGGDAAKARSSAVLSMLPRSIKKFLREQEIIHRLRHDTGLSQQKTMQISTRYKLPEHIERILLVDDSADTGASIVSAISLLSNVFPEVEIRVAVLNVFDRAKETVKIDWHLHERCLLSLPSSKDNTEYPQFMNQYETASFDIVSCKVTEEEPLISVVAAFYNIESCVNYCVDSLISQTYENYELILIDDGSTDSTGIKLDAYADNPKVRVVHKENGGLSNARNYGTSIARGDYVTFVDGDDLVSPYYLETLSSGLRYGKNVLVAALPTIIPIKSAQSYSWGDAPSDRVYKTLTSQEALEKVLYEEIKTSAWGKLAPRSLYEAHPFPEGKYYEEIATIGAYVMSVDRVVQTNAEIYGYVMRPNSIVHRKHAEMRQVRDYFDAVDEVMSCCDKAGIDLPARAFHWCLQLSRIHALLQAVDRTKDSEDAERRVSTGLAERLPPVLRSRRVSIANKIRFCLLKASPKAYDALFALFERIKKGI